MEKDYINISKDIERFRLVGKLLSEGVNVNRVSSLLNEDSSEYDELKNTKDDVDAVPYSMQDEIMSNITQTAKTQFGADFSQSKNPMLYYPKDGDVTLSGTISSMNDAKFQFRYKDSSGNGCYVWVSPLQLTDETIRKLSIINGVFKNWKNDLASAEDIKPMSLKNNQ